MKNKTIAIFICVFVLALSSCTTVNVPDIMETLTPITIAALGSTSPTPQAVCNETHQSGQLGNLTGVYATLFSKDDSGHAAYYLLQFYKDGIVIETTATLSFPYATLVESWPDISKWFYHDIGHAVKIKWTDMYLYGGNYYIQNHQIWFTTTAERNDEKYINNYCGIFSDDKMILSGYSNINGIFEKNAIYERVPVVNSGK